MSPLSIPFLVGAGFALALGAWLGSRLRPDTDWRRVLAMGVACLVVGAAGAAYGVLAQAPVPVADALPTNTIAGSAGALIAVALAWFGALLCGVAWAHALRPAKPAAPAADPEATIREPTLGPPPGPPA